MNVVRSPKLLPDDRPSGQSPRSSLQIDVVLLNSSWLQSQNTTFPDLTWMRGYTVRVPNGSVFSSLPITLTFPSTSAEPHGSHPMQHKGLNTFTPLLQRHDPHRLLMLNHSPGHMLKCDVIRQKEAGHVPCRTRDQEIGVAGR